MSSDNLQDSIIVQIVSLTRLSVYISAIELIRRLHYTNIVETTKLDKLLDRLSVRQLHSVNTTCDSWTDSLSQQSAVVQLLHRQLDKLSHVVFTLCDGLSNSFSRLNSRLTIQLYYKLPINLKLRPQYVTMTS